MAQFIAATSSNGTEVSSPFLTDENRVDSNANTSSAPLQKIESLAAAQYRNGDYLEAERLIRKALQIREMSQSTEDVDYFASKSHLAATLGRLKRYAEAEFLFREVLAKREEVLGANHVETLMAANYLAVALKQQGRVTSGECEQLFQRALSGLEAAIGVNHILTAEVSYNYAIVSVLLGKRKSAGKHFSIAHQAFEIALGVDNPHALDAMYWEVKCYDVVSDEQYVSKAHWQDSPRCEVCNREFGYFARRHHCRVCARCICHGCCPNKTVVPEFSPTEPQLFCVICEQQGF